MKNYFVTIPVVGYITLCVESPTPRGAKNKGLRIARENIGLSTDKIKDSQIAEWELEVQERLTQGNVSYFRVNEIDVEEA